MFNFKWYQFSDLTVSQLYSVLSLRSDIFIVEQNCVCLDPDGKVICAGFCRH
jgi:ElaA protein